MSILRQLRMRLRCIMSDRDTLLTISQVRRWKLRRVEIEGEMRALAEELDDLIRKLDASQIFLPARADSEPDETLDETSPPPEREAPEQQASATLEAELPPGESLSEAVLDAVRQLGGTPKPMAIRNRLAKTNPALGAKLAKNPNYFYTVLARHVNRRRLLKHGSGYRLPKESPRGEAGAAPPRQTSTQQPQMNFSRDCEEVAEVGGT